MVSGGDTHREGTCGTEVKRPKSCADGKVLNKKRNYAQFHLELGQPDFLKRIFLKKTIVQEKRIVL